MASLWIALCALISLTSSVTATRRSVNGNNGIRTVSDPVGNFLSELGDLFLDVDRTISVQTAPKVEYEDRLATQIFRPLQPPPSDYFNQVRQNYRDLQQRLGSLFAATPGALRERFSTDSFSTNERNPFIPSSLTPVISRISDNILKILAADEQERKTPVDTRSEKGPIPQITKVNEKNSEIFKETLPDISTNLLTAYHERPEDPRMPLSSPSQRQGSEVEERTRKIVENLIAEARRTNEALNSMSSRTLDELSSVLVRRMGDLPEDSKPQERIIGDALHSESRFDKYIRQLLRRQGKWLLDNPLKKIWRDSLRISQRGTAVVPTTETASEVPSTERSTDETTEHVPHESQTVAYIPTSTESSIDKTKPGRLPRNQLKPHPVSASYYRVDDNGIVEEEVDFVLKSESDSEVGIETETDEAEERTGLAAVASSIDTTKPGRLPRNKLKPHPLISASYYEVDDNGIVEEEVDFVLKSESDSEDGIETETDVVQERTDEDTLILAFTPDGIPLKLRIGPEISNPLGYLQRILRLAGVNLKVPVESIQDIEPAGKEVLLLGAGADIMRAVYINVSNRNELKSLIRTLMKFKASGKN